LQNNKLSSESYTEGERENWRVVLGWSKEQQMSWSQLYGRGALSLCGVTEGAPTLDRD